MASYLDLNRANWDDRASAHAASPDYSFDRFVADPELPQRGRPVRPPAVGRRARAARRAPAVPHRHRHRLARPARRDHDRARLLGRVDRRSPAAVDAGRHAGRVRGVERVRRAGACCRAGGFDLVYTGIGALCWLPDVRRWAAVVAGLLRPGGRLFIREGHPMLWALDEARTDAVVVDYPYFERVEPLIDEDAGNVRRHRRPSSPTTSRTAGTTASVRSSPRCSMPGCS